ncbi:MAG TPA: efflux transporter outer membrane subunit [Steroidobacteraceae bacterium]|nr:efflux transporter outer membrane subunit [Steroidobacteraceae bacterium]
MRGGIPALKPVQRAVLLVLSGIGVALGGCAVGPNYRVPDIPVPDHYAAMASAPAGNAATTGKAPQATDLAAWWHSLADPELDSLIDRAIGSNPDIEIALDRLQEARTFEAGMLGLVLPDLDGSAAAARGTGSDLTRGRATQALVSSDNASGLKHINEIGGFDSLWELDLFGKYRRELQAARADTQALAAARDGVLVAVVADVARAYIELRGAQMRLATLQATIQALGESQRIVHIRFQRGITNELDVTLADRELADERAQLAPVEAQVTAGEDTLATLLGTFPENLASELASPGMVPAVPALSPAGLPLQLLKQRPDIQQAERELAASSARIGVATADLFPDVAVTAAIGFQRQGLGTDPAIGQHIWSAGPSVLWPLLDFGTLDAQVDIADLRTRALLVSYRKTIQAAVSEVDTALSRYAAQQSRLQQLELAVTASQRAVTLSQQRYDRGLTDYLNVVDAQRAAYDIQIQYVDAQTTADDQFVAVYRSLGGGWEHYQKLPPIRRPQPAIIAAFRRLVHPN